MVLIFLDLITRRGLVSLDLLPVPLQISTLLPTSTVLTRHDASPTPALPAELASMLPYHPKHASFLSLPSLLTSYIASSAIFLPY